jgi:ParB/RepB/Spo0J family partition protein
MKSREEYQVYSIPVEQIYFDSDFNCRDAFTPQSVKELADSITEAGRLICPVAIQPWGKDGYAYRLLVGHRRFKAITIFLKWPEIPAYICHDLSDHDAQKLNLAENLQRKSLTILEESRALKKLYPNGVTLRKAAAELKQPTKWVHIRLRLLQMPESVQQQAAAGLLTAVNIERLAGLETPADQIVIAEQISEARERCKGHRQHLTGVDPRFKRYQTVRNKTQINHMIERMFKAGIQGLPCRVASWCANHISDEELLEDIKNNSTNRVKRRRAI